MSKIAFVAAFLLVASCVPASVNAQTGQAAKVADVQFHLSATEPDKSGMREFEFKALKQTLDDARIECSKKHKKKEKSDKCFVKEVNGKEIQVPDGRKWIIFATL